MNLNVLWLLWSGFIAYVIFLTPSLHLEATLKLLIKILTLQWTQVNPVILYLFIALLPLLGRFQKSGKI